MRLWVRVLVCLVGSLLTGFVLTGCSTFGKQNELSQSLATWNQLKTENGGYYRYETSSSSWTGASSTTTLTVQNGKVIVRAYEASRLGDDPNAPAITESWTEEGAAVGSHEAGAEPVTIDALYQQCRDEVLTQNAQANELYLDFQDNGVLETCKYRPLDCVDDCLFGVAIDRLEFLKD